MLEVTRDIWDFPCDWLCITTNGIIDSKGKAAMGRGIAHQAKQKYPGIEDVLAKKLKENGNIVFCLGEYDRKKIFSFPTKNHWRDKSDPNLIIKSAKELAATWKEADYSAIVALPRPGCMNGGLLWEDVSKLIAPILDTDFFIILNR